MAKLMADNDIRPDAITIPYFVRGDWRNGDELAMSMRQLASWPAIRAQIVGAPFLVIDDLGAARMTPHIKTETASILMARHREQRKTIITTNMSLQDMAAEIDGRIESRLHEGIILHTGEADLRKRQNT
jgi:DNA replication protein DnaC